MITLTDDDMENAFSAAEARKGNEIGIKSTDALRIVAEYHAVLAAAEAEQAGEADHGQITQIIGFGKDFRPDEHDRGYWRENEDGVCVEFSDGYRDCFYVSELFTHQPKPELQDIAAYIGVGGYNGATTEQLVQSIKDEFSRLTALPELESQKVEGKTE